MSKLKPFYADWLEAGFWLLVCVFGIFALAESWIIAAILGAICILYGLFVLTKNQEDDRP